MVWRTFIWKWKKSLLKWFQLLSIYRMLYLIQKTLSFVNFQWIFEHFLGSLYFPRNITSCIYECTFSTWIKQHQTVLSFWQFQDESFHTFGMTSLAWLCIAFTASKGWGMLNIIWNYGFATLCIELQLNSCKVVNKPRITGICYKDKEEESMNCL